MHHTESTNKQLIDDARKAGLTLTNKLVLGGISELERLVHIREDRLRAELISENSPKS